MCDVSDWLNNDVRLGAGSRYLWEETGRGTEAVSGIFLSALWKHIVPCYKQDFQLGFFEEPWWELRARRAAGCVLHKCCTSCVCSLFSLSTLYHSRADVVKQNWCSAQPISRYGIRELFDFYCLCSRFRRGKKALDINEDVSKEVLVL